MLIGKRTGLHAQAEAKAEDSIVIMAEYIWMDGTALTRKLRSKTKILEKGSWLERKTELPEWGFDGSSTGQASSSVRIPLQVAAREGATSKTGARARTWTPTSSPGFFSRRFAGEGDIRVMVDQGSWRDALMRLHVSGWDTDDIDSACEELTEACEEGKAAGRELSLLSAEEVDDILDVDVDPRDVPALLTIAAARASQGDSAEALQAALYDLDAFAYEYAGID